MMGTLATVLATKKIRTSEDVFWAEVEGDIERIDNILKITSIRVNYHLKVPKEMLSESQEAFNQYLTLCPVAQSLIGCISIKDNLTIEEVIA